MTEDDARDFLRGRCGEAGGQRAWALAHCISPAYVSDVLSGRRTIGPGMANALGLERIISYLHAHHQDTQP